MFYFHAIVSSLQVNNLYQMRSSLGLGRPSATTSQLPSFSTMSNIRTSNNIVTKQARFTGTDEFASFDRLFGQAALSEKDIADVKRLGYTYRKYENGDIYYGQADADRPHGQGLYIYWSLASDRLPYFYKGNFDRGEFSGFGKLCKLVNDKEAVFCYQGSWKNGKREGDGMENYSGNGDSNYRGAWSNDQRNGFGTLTSPGCTCEGNWVNGKMNGQGTQTIERGALKVTYTGNWVDDQLSQGAIMYYNTANKELLGRYEGGIRNYMRQGDGKYIQGSIEMRGKFSNDQLVGYSVLKNITTQAEYEIKGDYTRSDLSSLEAEIKYSNNDKFVGLVDVDRDSVVRRTRGMYTFANGERKQGSFQDNEQGELILK